MRQALPLAVGLLLLAGCEDMSALRRKSYAPFVSLAAVPPDIARLDEQSRHAPPVTLALLKRGQERFHIYCAPCHAELGDGRGMIVQRGFPTPPSLHVERLRQAQVQHFYEVITNGFGAMYSFAERVQSEDRWAIVAYIRALQRSQNAAPRKSEATQK
jgi:mono/diheme cytochrome c family protein